MVHIEDSPYFHIGVSQAYYILSKECLLWRWIWQNNWTLNFYIQPSIPHINSDTNPPPLFVNVVCKYLRQFLGTSFGVATLPICCNIELWGKRRWFVSAKWTIPEYADFFPGIVLVSIIYERYCHKNWGS